MVIDRSAARLVAADSEPDRTLPPTRCNHGRQPHEPQMTPVRELSSSLFLPDYYLAQVPVSANRRQYCYSPRRSSPTARRGFELILVNAPALFQQMSQLFLRLRQPLICS